MPEKEARPPAQNRHGGAPRGERVPLDARRASISADRRASRARQQKTCAFRRSARPSWGRMEKRKAKTRAQQRAAGTKKTALFDIVNRNIAATRSVPGRACEKPRLWEAPCWRRVCYSHREMVFRNGRNPRVRYLRVLPVVLSALVLLATPVPAQTPTQPSSGGYTAPAEFMDLFFDFTGSG